MLLVILPEKENTGSLSTLQLHVNLSVSFRNGCYCWNLCIGGSIYSFGYSLRGPCRTLESPMTKFRFIHSGIGETFWRKTQRNETIAQLCDLEHLQLYPLCFVMSMNSKGWLKTFYAFKFFHSMFSSLICIY